MPLRLVVLLAALLGPMAVLPTCARADCNGFMNQTKQGYKLEGDRLEPSGPKVAAGTELEFNGIIRIKDHFFLTRTRSDVMFDAQNVELTSGCDLPTKPAPQAR